jgi:uncharacterized protein YjbI with pentapeptide repeats
MEEKLRQFLDKAFAPYGNFPSRADVSKELLANLFEKYQDLKEEGKSDEEAYQITIDSFGNVEEIMEELPHGEKKLEASQSLRQTLKKTLRQAKSSMGFSKFGATVLKQADLSDSNLAAEDFSYSALIEIIFDRSDLTETTFRASALKGASFIGSNISSAAFTASDLQNVSFNNADLNRTVFQASNLKGAIFDGATLVNTEFRQSDLSSVVFDSQELDGVVFKNSSLKKTSFKNAILHNVTFHHTDVKHAVFDGTKMDKITYALLKGAGATLDNVLVM